MYCSIGTQMRLADDRIRVMFEAERHPEQGAAPHTFRLVAAVAWRFRQAGGPAYDRGRWAHPAEWFRWLGRARELRRAGRSVFRGPGFGPGMDQETSFVSGASGGCVIIRGRSFSLPPDGRTLVLLVDETQMNRREPRVTVRMVPAPERSLASLAPAGPRVDPALASAYRVSVGGALVQPIPEPLVEFPAWYSEAMRTAHPTWTAAICVDPEVQAFLEVGR